MLIRLAVPANKSVEDFFREADAVISTERHNMNAKLAEVTKERDELEARINSILASHELLAKNFAKIVESLSQSSAIHPEDLVSPCYSPFL